MVTGTLSTQNNTNDIHKMKAPKHISPSDTCIYRVEPPISEHWRQEIKVDEKAEFKNLQDYDTFMEVKDEGQTKVGSSWAITKKSNMMVKRQKLKLDWLLKVFKKYYKHNQIVLQL